MERGEGTLRACSGGARSDWTSFFAKFGLAGGCGAVGSLLLRLRWQIVHHFSWFVGRFWGGLWFVCQFLSLGRNTLRRFTLGRLLGRRGRGGDEIFRADFAELIERAVVLAVEAGIVLFEHLHAVRFIVDGVEGFGLADDLVGASVFLLEGLGLGDHFEVDGGGLNAPVAALCPLEDDHFFDELCFDFVYRLQRGDLRVGEKLEKFAGFVGEADGLGGDAAEEAVEDGGGAGVRRF